VPEFREFFSTKQNKITTSNNNLTIFERSGIRELVVFGIPIQKYKKYILGNVQEKKNSLYELQFEVTECGDVLGILFVPAFIKHFQFQSNDEINQFYNEIISVYANGTHNHCGHHEQQFVSFSKPKEVVSIIINFGGKSAEITNKTTKTTTVVDNIPKNFCLSFLLMKSKISILKQKWNDKDIQPVFIAN